MSEAPTLSRPDRENALIPLVLLIAMGVLTALMLSLAKSAYEGGVHPFAFAFWQTAGAGLVLLALNAARGRRLPLSRHHLRYYAVAGLSGLALPNAIIFFVVSKIGAGLGGLLYAFPSLITLAAALLMRQEKASPYRLAGIALGCAGSLVILLPEGAIPPDAVGWLLFGFLAPFSLAFGNIYRTVDWPAGTAAPVLAAGMLLGAGAELALLLLILGVPATGPHMTAEMVAILALQIVITALAYLCFFEVQRRAGPVYLSQIGYIVTLSGLVLAAVLHGERYDLWVWGGVAVVVSGVVLTTRARMTGK